MADDRTNITLKVPKEIHRMAKIEAAKTGKSFQTILDELLRKWLSGEIKINGNEPQK